MVTLYYKICEKRLSIDMKIIKNNKDLLFFMRSMYCTLSVVSFSASRGFLTEAQYFTIEVYFCFPDTANCKTIRRTYNSKLYHAIREHLNSLLKKQLTCRQLGLLRSTMTMLKTLKWSLMQGYSYSHSFLLYCLEKIFYIKYYKQEPRKHIFCPNSQKYCFF